MTRPAVASVEFLTEDPSVAVLTLAEESALQNKSNQRALKVKQAEEAMKGGESCETEIMGSQIVKLFSNITLH